MGSERGIECDGALFGQRRSGAMVDGGRSHQTDSAVTVFIVVPGEELLVVSASVGVRDEVLLTATAQNLRRLVKLLCRAPPPFAAACPA